MAVKAVVFDLDGAVVLYPERPTAELIAEGGRRACQFALSRNWPLGNPDSLLGDVMDALERERRRVEPTCEEVVAHRVVEGVLKEAGVTWSHQDLKGFGIAWHQPFAEGSRLLPGTEDTLMSLLAHGARLGLVTNNWWGKDAIEWELDKLGLWEFFDGVIVSSEVGCRKPSPKIFSAATRELGVPAGSTVFVGAGAVEDLAGAQAAGMTAMLFGTDVTDMDNLLKRLGGMMI